MCRSYSCSVIILTRSKPFFLSKFLYSLLVVSSFSGFVLSLLTWYQPILDPLSSKTDPQILLFFIFFLLPHYFSFIVLETLILETHQRHLIPFLTLLKILLVSIICILLITLAPSLFLLLLMAPDTLIGNVLSLLASLRRIKCPSLMVRYLILLLLLLPIIKLGFVAIIW